MVYLEQESNTQIYGDVQTNKVSFKEENMDFIMSILSSNLYSNPIGSLIREYVSNAEDSHREAGIDDPILVTLDKNEYDDNFFFSVQDFGVGISPERFEDVFINLASSTKRESNTYIGMWGLGRLSGLSYSSQINITSIYNGTKTYYLMYKDGNKIFIDSLGSEDTEDRNGVTITVPVNKKDLDSFCREIIKQLSFFEKVHINTCEPRYFDYFVQSALERHLEMSKIKYYNTFAINTYYPNIESIDNFCRPNSTLRILLGNVVYPIKFDLITLPKYIASNENLFIRFAIGELEVTPNREDILYSRKNIETINKRLLEAQEEKLKVFKDIYNKDVNDIIEYDKYLSDSNPFLYVMENENKYTTNVNLYFGDKISYKYHGIDYKKEKSLKDTFLSTLELFYNVCMFYQRYDIEDGKISNFWRERQNDFILNNLKNVLICDFSNLSKREKRYFRDEILPFNKYYYILTEPNKKTWFKKIIRRKWDFSKKLIDKKLLKIFIGEFLEKIKDIPVFDSSSVPEDYILPKKKRDNDNSEYNKENIQFNYIKLSKNDPTATSLSAYSCTPKEINNFTVYAPKENDYKIRALCHFMYKQVRYTSSTRYSNNIHFCTVAPGKIKYLQDNSNLISLEDFMNTDTPHLRGLATVEYLNREYPMLENLCRIANLGVIHPDLLNVQQQYNALIWKYDYFKTNMRYNNVQKELMSEIYKVCKENDWWDNEMKDYFDKYSNLIKGAEILLVFLNGSATIPENMINLIVDYITTKNLFDVSEEAKKKLKRETVFNIKK